MIITKYLDQIDPYLKTGKYIFRGVSNSRYLNETGDLRRMPSTEIEDFQSYNIDLVKQARKQGYGEKSLKELSDLEMLAELQHFGAATCLLDFTRNFLTALWFAIDGNPDKDGKIYYLNEQNLEKIDSKEDEDKNIKEFLSNETNYSWTPQIINSRIIAQDSVFVLGSPILNNENIKEIVVDKDDKPNIRYELNEFFNLNDSTLFPDLQGFALANSSDKSSTSFSGDLD
tara:strand:+ start:5454 stop:6140 length:687 start_codon:yes stop_codon:yes gene_type:complete